MLVERWNRDQIVFTASGLVTWYVAYVAFRNLKSYVPFVTDRLVDPELARLDRMLWLGNDPAQVLHDLLGTTWANWVMAAVYLVWIGLVPASLAIALVWTRRSSAGAWYVTAISLDWMLGAALYYAVPSLGPTYSSPEWFADLPRTPNSSVRDVLLADRIEVLGGPWDTSTVQTIAAFASLHVAVMVTICLVAEAMRLPVVIRVAAWTFLALTMVATIYLGWHFFVDVLAGIAVGAAAFVLAARATGNPLRRRERAVDLPRGPGHHGQLPSATPSEAGAADAVSGGECLAQLLGVRRRLAVGVLRPRPEEAAQPVALGARHDVEVQVRHRLAHGVVDRDERPLRTEGLRDRDRDTLRGLHERVAELGREVRQRVDVLARHQQDVPLEHRPRVEERDEVVGLEHEVTGQVAGDDLAEDARAHGSDRATGVRRSLTRCASPPLTARSPAGPAADSPRPTSCKVCRLRAAAGTSAEDVGRLSTVRPSTSAMVRPSSVTSRVSASYRAPWHVGHARVGPGQEEQLDRRPIPRPGRSRSDPRRTLNENRPAP